MLTLRRTYRIIGGAGLPLELVITYAYLPGCVETLFGTESEWGVVERPPVLTAKIP